MQFQRNACDKKNKWQDGQICVHSSNNSLILMIFKFIGFFHSLLWGPTELKNGKIIFCLLKEFQMTYLAKSLFEAGVCNSSQNFQCEANLPSCYHSDRVWQHRKPTENKVFNINSVSAEIFKVSGKNSHHESILLEDPCDKNYFKIVVILKKKGKADFSFHLFFKEYIELHCRQATNRFFPLLSC